MKSKKLFILGLVLLAILLSLLGWKIYQKKFVKVKTDIQKNIKQTQIINPHKDNEIKNSGLETQDTLLNNDLNKIESIPFFSESQSGQQFPSGFVTPPKKSPFIEISGATDQKIAEGSQFSMDQIQVKSLNNKPLEYYWELMDGPGDAIKIDNRNRVHPLISIGDLNKNTTFILRLSARDGDYETDVDIAIKAFAAVAISKDSFGGEIRNIIHLGDGYLLAQGNQLKWYDTNLALLGELDMGEKVKDIFVNNQDSNAKWALVHGQNDQWYYVFVSNQILMKQVINLTVGVKQAYVFIYNQTPHVLTMTNDKVSLWDLTNLSQIRLVKEVANPVKEAQWMSYYGGKIYLADEFNIKLVDLSTGNLLVSIPTGGSINYFNVINIIGLGHEQKPYLLVGIGQDRSNMNRLDYGIRLYAIANDGKLNDEGRILLKGNPSVEGFHYIPNVNLGLVKIKKDDHYFLRLIDILGKKELVLQLQNPIQFNHIIDIETGKMGEQPVAIIADGSELLVLDFILPKTIEAYSVKIRNQFKSIQSAHWIHWAGDNKLLLNDSIANKLVLLNVDNTTILADEKLNSEEDILFNKNTKDGSWALGIIKDKLTQNVKLYEILSDDKIKASALPWEHGEFLPQGFDVKKLSGQNYLAMAMMPKKDQGAGALLIKRISGNVAKNINGKKPLKPVAETQLSQKPQEKLYPFEEAYDVVLNDKASFAYVASGKNGVTSVDLLTGEPKTRVRLRVEEFFATRIWMIQEGKILVVSFIRPNTQEVMLKFFRVEDDIKLSELGAISGIPAIKINNTLFPPQVAFTEDGNFIFVPQGKDGLAIYNVSNPLNPSKIVQIPNAVAVNAAAVLGKFEKIVMSQGEQGIKNLSFGFKP